MNIRKNKINKQITIRYAMDGDMTVEGDTEKSAEFDRWEFRRETKVTFPLSYQMRSGTLKFVQILE